MRSLVLALVLAGGLLGTCSAAGAATPIRPADLGTWHAKGEVADRVLDELPRARPRAGAGRSERFLDEDGHVITIDTDLPDVDLAPFAQVLGAVYHHDEIEDLAVTVIAPEAIAGICGDDAVACYLPEDQASSFRGQVWLPSEDPDLVHIVVHEYGHHVDNQLVNFAGCGWDADGSRNWLFARQIEDDILGRAGCSSDRAWEELLAEIYAEDFTWLNGNDVWRRELPVRPPSDVQLQQLRSDFDRPFQPRTIRSGRLVRGGSAWVKDITVEDWTFFLARVGGPRRAGFDLRLSRRGERRPLAVSEQAGSREQLFYVLPPGRYRVSVLAGARSGHARLRIALG